MKKKYVVMVLGVVLFCLGICYIQILEVDVKKTRQPFVAIDVGHGGFDPGKVGTTGTLEKDINLAIAKKLRLELEKQGVNVLLTRDSDMDLCQEGQGKKNSDLQKRVELINQSGVDLAVSIHQNSFTDASVQGCQVFYYEGSEQGKQLAKFIQDSVKSVIDRENHRVEKANTSYYILKNSSCPIVIIECGFLSNPEEEALLQEEDYQQLLAKGICKGILLQLKAGE